MAKKSAERLDPVELVARRFEARGITRYNIAKELGKDASLIYQWQYRGQGIPTKQQKPLLELARRKNVKLTAEEIINGGLL